MNGEAIRTDSTELPKVSLKNYFTGSEWLAYAILVIAGLLLRWLELDVRPYHHDESQHAMFGKYFFDFPEIQYYKYDPMMHGPLLYNLMRVVYTALGNTLWSARVPVAILGSVFVFAPLLFRRHFSSTALLGLTAIISLSPTMVYWSRFIIHDYYVLTAQLITLYGVVVASNNRKAFFVLLGIALQFSIKANVFVTLAILLGYLVYEAAIRYFFLDNRDQRMRTFFQYFLRNILIFLVLFAAFTMATHYRIGLLGIKNEHWGGLVAFADNTFMYVLACFVLCTFIYIISFFVFQKEDYLIRRTVDYIWKNKISFIISFAFAALVLCYIASSGFRHNEGILDLLYEKSIPYWLNQHNIERIQGPFLFNFYMLSWYEIVFMTFLGVHLYLFYSTAPKISKYCGWIMLGLASFVGVFLLFYIKPDAINGYWKSMADLGKRKPEELKGFIDVIATHFIGFFKLKDCLDGFGVIIILLHPFILCTTHILRNEKVLAFWGYFFTASFFSYSYLGEKVPWLSVYPLITGIIYLALYFDDWFKRNPISDYRDYPLSKILKVTAIISLTFAIIFTLEEMFSLSEVVKDFTILAIWKLYEWKTLTSVYNSIFEGVKNNLSLFILGLALYTLYYTNRWTDLLGKVNLKTFIFILAGFICFRGAVLTNFVHAGSETEFISQVHTTHEFHNLMLKLRNEAESDIREKPFKVLGEGDPVWPMTWYFVGINEFKWQATPEERKDFDVIIQTYEENINNVPEGFEKRRLNLRGWWVPDYNQMTLKKFLNVSLNHIPWSPSGFTYVWVLRNTASDRR